MDTCSLPSLSQICLTFPLPHVAHVELARPHKSNALNQELLNELHALLAHLAQDTSLRALMLTGQGPNFCAGADLEWMAQSIDYTPEDNLVDAHKLSRVLHALDTFPVPTIGLAHGRSIGGGAGLLSCCDSVIASQEAQFSFPEVRLGLAPAIISPYIQRAIGERQARYYFLTGAIFDAATALRIGLVHEVIPTGDLMARGEALLHTVLASAPQALKVTKNLIAHVGQAPMDEALRHHTITCIATLRTQPEAQERLRAFLAGSQRIKSSGSSPS